MTSRFFRLALFTWIVAWAPAKADESTAGAQRLAESRRLFFQAQQPTGVLVPLYHYPANIHTNVEFNRLIELKKSFPTVPICVILNPANGPGEGAIDLNYVKAVDRLNGAGLIMLGYVSTRFATQPHVQVLQDTAAWHTRYPKVSGLFFDEMSNKPDEPTVKYYSTATTAAHESGFWPVFANPGTSTPEKFFADSAADVFVIHENSFWPAESDLKGDYFGGYSDYPLSTRGVLMHSQKSFDKTKFAMVRKHIRWIYVTHDQFDENANPNDPKNNPWDELSRYLEEILEELSRKN